MTRPDNYKGFITQNYYPQSRVYLINGKKVYHQKHGGVDIGSKGGKNIPVVTPARGTVVQIHKKVGNSYYLYKPNNVKVKSADKVSGQFVVIRSSTGLRLYHYMGHLNTISVKVGHKVKAKQQIGTMGKTGSATGVHVHWEIWRQLWKRFYIDPLKKLRSSS